jgi:hypothetical protein
VNIYLTCGIFCRIEGATLCGSAAEVAAKSDAIFTIVGYPRDVEEVILGPSGNLNSIGAKVLSEMWVLKYIICGRLFSKGFCPV